MLKQIQLEWEYKYNYHLVVGQDSFDRTGETGPVYKKQCRSRILSFLIGAGIGTLIFIFSLHPKVSYINISEQYIWKFPFTGTGRIIFMISIDSIKLLEECLLNIWNGFQCDVKKVKTLRLIPFEHSFLRSLETVSQLFRYFRQLFCIFPRRHVGSVIFDPVHCHILT